MAGQPKRTQEAQPLFNAQQTPDAPTHTPAHPLAHLTAELDGLRAALAAPPGQAFQPRLDAMEENGAHSRPRAKEPQIVQLLWLRGIVEWNDPRYAKEPQVLQLMWFRGYGVEWTPGSAAVMVEGDCGDNVFEFQIETPNTPNIIFCAWGGSV